MKRILSLLLVLSLLVSASAALADGMGVHVISGPQLERETVTIDNLMLGAKNEISGWGILTAKNYLVWNSIWVVDKGKSSMKDASYNDSGADAEYALLFVDIINTQMVGADFLTEVEVKAVYDEVYEFGGWYFQSNSDISTTVGIDPADNFAIEPMCTGHYIFGCTLPNTVIRDKKPLRLVITIDGNELTYNIRK